MCPHAGRCWTCWSVFAHIEHIPIQFYRRQDSLYASNSFSNCEGCHLQRKISDFTSQDLQWEGETASVLCIFLSYFILLMIFPNMRIEAASRFEVSQADMTLMFDPFQMSLHMHPHVGLLPALPATPLLATGPHHTPSPEPGARVSVFVHHCV